MRFLGKREIPAIGELVTVIDYQLDKSDDLKECITHVKQEHKLEEQDDCRLEQGLILRCFCRKKVPIVVCPSKPDSKKIDDRWEEEATQAKRRKR